MSGVSLMHDCMMHPAPHEALGRHGHLECLKVCLIFAKSCQEERQKKFIVLADAAYRKSAYMRFENST